MTPGSIAMLLGETHGRRVQRPCSWAPRTWRSRAFAADPLLLSDGWRLYGVDGGSLSLLQVVCWTWGRLIVKSCSALYGRPRSAASGTSCRSGRARARCRCFLNAEHRAGRPCARRVVELRRGTGWSVPAGSPAEKRQDRDDDGWSTGRCAASWPRRSCTACGTRPSSQPSAGSRRTGRGARSRPPRRRTGCPRRGSRLPAGRRGPRRPFRVRTRLAAEHARLLHVSARRPAARRRARARSRTTGLRGGRPRRQRGIAHVARRRHAPGRRVASQDLPRFDYDDLMLGFFAQDDVRLGQRVALGVSARFDHHPRYGSFLSRAASRCCCALRPE